MILLAHAIFKYLPTIIALSLCVKKIIEKNGQKYSVLQTNKSIHHLEVADELVRETEISQGPTEFHLGDD